MKRKKTDILRAVVLAVLLFVFVPVATVSTLAAEVADQRNAYEDRSIDTENNSAEDPDPAPEEEREETDFHPVGWTRQGDVYTYVNPDGSLYTGWLQLGNTWYFLKDDGVMATGWVEDKGHWYYLRSSGAMATGWVEDKGHWYYLRSSGAMATGWVKDKGHWYYLRSGGAMATGWVKDKGHWYYLRSGGAMATGWVEDKGHWYYLRSSGAMATGWIRDKGHWYYLRSGGAMATGWVKVGAFWYWLDATGIMKTGWITTEGSWYYLESSGAMKTGWKRLGDVWYYLDPSSGKMLTGRQVINGKTYILRDNGAWKTNGYVIEIDPGHQRRADSGLEPNGPGSGTMKAKVSSGTRGVATGIYEYELNLTVSLLLREELEARGYKVCMTRETHDIRISNVERAKKATADGADITVRIHANGGGGRGVLNVVPTNSNRYLSKTIIAESQRLGQLLTEYQTKATGQRALSLYKTDTMTGINWSTMPVTLVEMGFMDNAWEDRFINDPKNQIVIARALADGIDAYFSG